MGIEKYKLAECKLFRQPPVDVSVVKDTLERFLVQAWKEGRPADWAVNAALEDRRVVGKLAEQIEENMDFQRKAALEAIEIERTAALRDYGREQKAQLRELEKTLGKEAGDRARLAEETRKGFEERQRAYNYTQQRLEEMRRRVKTVLEELGGEKGVEELLRIREYLAKPVEVSDVKVEVRKDDGATTTTTVATPTSGAAGVDAGKEYAGAGISAGAGSGEQTTDAIGKEKSLENIVAADKVPETPLRKTPFWRKMVYYITFRRPPKYVAVKVAKNATYGVKVEGDKLENEKK